MLEIRIPIGGPKTTGERLVDLLDYVEQVVRLDERVAFRVSDYALPDRSVLAVAEAETVGLPGLRCDLRDDDGPIWLALDRLARRDPPVPADRLAPWLDLGADPATPPALIERRLETVSATGRALLLAADQAVEEDFAPVPESVDAAPGEPRFDRILRLDEASRAEATAYVEGAWRTWAEDEIPRRRSISLYGRLYKLQQQLELGGADSAIEAVWGIGPVRWNHAGRTIDRPLIERLVEVELDTDGTLKVRPRGNDARVDLKPYEEMGCPNLGLLEDTIRSEIVRTAEDDGIGPFRPDTFGPILTAAAARLDPSGRYVQRPDTVPDTDLESFTVTDGWVLFARPRSQHVLIDDIARFRSLAREADEIAGLARRLVTAPADNAGPDWQPLSDRLGAVPSSDETPAEASITEVFFPKPFNEDQIAIVARLACAEGLVVQGPPGTGKTHTIANLICHAMALGQRVLVVSRGEAALSVLRDQLPEKVRPLVISILSNERQGLRQVETAIREIQAVVEENRPEIRLSAIRRCEAEILKVRSRLAAIDAELDEIAELQTRPLGPRGEAPAELARRLLATRDRTRWFPDRPAKFHEETGLGEPGMTALGEARVAAAGVLDHIDAVLPALDQLPRPDVLCSWHEDLRRARVLAADYANGPAHALRVAPGDVQAAERVVKALRDLAAAREAAARHDWLVPLLDLAARRESSPWLEMLRDIATLSWGVDAERTRLVREAVEFPARLIDDEAARAAVSRAAAGDRLWPLLSVGRSRAKDLVADVRVQGHWPDADQAQWQAVEAQVRLLDQRRELSARWRIFASEAGAAPDAHPGGPAVAADVLAGQDALEAALAALGPAARGLPPIEVLAGDGGLARALALQIEGAAASARLAAADAERAAAAALFDGHDRTSAMARQVLAEIIGREDVEAERVGSVWAALEKRIGLVHAAAEAFAVIRRQTDLIAAAGAPLWAKRLRNEPPAEDADGLLPDDWREAWDDGAASFHLARIDGRDRLSGLAREREAEDRRGRRLFVELVRERAFLALDRRLSPRVKSALVEYVRALGRLGKGTGKGAGRHRRAARDAMSRCYDAVPCWIMPTWRVAEQLPADLAAFDLVILDEASQSDVTELPALLRGRKILAVGDDRQVSPTPPFVSPARLEQLRHHYLRDLPFRTLLEPGESLYDLLRAVFPDSRLMLKEHFRCVEPIIRFSMQFYPERLVPLRIPSAQERIDPPLVDILVPHGEREGARKINRAEAEVIVDEIARIAEDPAQSHRSLGVISLIGADQAELIRVMLADRIGAEAMQRHAILCGDSATFQGNERDVVFLSMVADRKRRSTLTMLRYEQRFNVAASRARDRLVLVRSVLLEDLNPKDLKARLIAHFDDPMPVRAAGSDDPLGDCESGFERDLMRQLLERGFRVEPQVGAEGFRIDLVVEGAEGRRLAVECDGDTFHGPEQWREDMRRQRILERVGWRFWRCFASSFYRDPDAVTADLVETLRELGIEPSWGEGRSTGSSAFTEKRRVSAPAAELAGTVDAATTLRPGDRVSLLFGDRKRLDFRLTPDRDDESAGLVGIETPLGQALATAEEGDEIEVPNLDGAPARAIVEAVARA